MFIEPVTTQDTIDKSVDQIKDGFDGDDDLNPDFDDAYDAAETGESILDEMAEEEFLEDSVFYIAL